MTNQITIPRETFDQMREALESSAACIQFMTDGPRRADWGNTLDIIDEALTAAKAVTSECSKVTSEYSVQPHARDAVTWTPETGYVFAAPQPAVQPVHPAKLQVTLEDRPIDVELAQYKRMFEAACVDLGLINEALGLDPNDGGAEPILDAIAELKAVHPQAQESWKLVPAIPNEEQWGGLARDIMMWLDMDGRKTAGSLFKHLERCGTEIPQWLRDEPEMKNLDHVPSKGTRVTIIYRAMLAAAPAPKEEAQ